MTPLESGVRLVAGVFLVPANGFSVAVEFALTRARQFSEDERLDGDVDPLDDVVRGACRGSVRSS